MSATPILDREQPLPKLRRTSYWYSAVLGAALGVVLIFWSDDSDDWASPTLWVLAKILVAFYFAVLWHELGHLVAGSAAGFEVRNLSVGGFLIEKQNRGWRLRFLPRRWLSGGFAGMMPRSTDRLAQRFAWLVAGGPLASLLLLAILTPARDGPLRTLVFVNLFVVAVCSIPFNSRSGPNDAKLLLAFLGKPAAAEQLANLLYLIALDGQGVLPRAWPASCVAMVTASQEHLVLRSSSLVVQYALAQETADPEAIGGILEAALARVHGLTPASQLAFFVAASCFQASFRRRPDLADCWLEAARKVKHAVKQKDWDSKAVGVIALAKGDRQAARESLQRYQALLEQRPPSGAVAAERARIAALLEATV